MSDNINIVQQYYIQKKDDPDTIITYRNSDERTDWRSENENVGFLNFSNKGYLVLFNEDYTPKDNKAVKLIFYEFLFMAQFETPHEDRLKKACVTKKAIKGFMAWVYKPESSSMVLWKNGEGFIKSKNETLQIASSGFSRLKITSSFYMILSFKDFILARIKSDIDLGSYSNVQSLVNYVKVLPVSRGNWEREMKLLYNDYVSLFYFEDARKIEDVNILNENLISLFQKFFNVYLKNNKAESITAYKEFIGNKEEEIKRSFSEGKLQSYYNHYLDKVIEEFASENTIDPGINHPNIPAHKPPIIKRFSTNKKRIYRGKFFTLRWEVEEATKVYLNGVEQKNSGKLTNKATEPIAYVLSAENGPHKIEEKIEIEPRRKSQAPLFILLILVLIGFAYVGITYRDIFISSKKDEPVVVAADTIEDGVKEDKKNTEVPKNVIEHQFKIQEETYKYTGKVENNLPNGKGKAVYTHSKEHNTSYEGDFKDGLRNGDGVLINKHPEGGGTYIGKFKNNKKEGAGKYTWESGNFFEGSFLDDELYTGTYYDKDGKKLVEYKDGKQIAQ